MTLNPITAHRARLDARLEASCATAREEGRSQAVAAAIALLQDRAAQEHGTPGAAHRRKALRKAAGALSAEASTGAAS
ncbi:hypothetical protein [Nocardioides sp. GY 10127]|uniref:hypothetical protein n=1 Tax=Nocardioides sp. GY 10127 TaxID=2569762 RepID=UPI0010A8A6F4|nr:hypothetical protein [Nocardioides sp. GY 10127]TIC78800.1 hypothetical protein E8D37_19075 [Nocardioides sp. GY 10127]